MRLIANRENLKPYSSRKGIGLALFLTLALGCFWVSLVGVLAPFSRVDFWILIPMAAQAISLMLLWNDWLMKALFAVVSSPGFFAFDSLRRSKTIEQFLEGYLGYLELYLLIGIWLPSFLAVYLRHKSHAFLK